MLSATSVHVMAQSGAKKVPAYTGPKVNVLLDAMGADRGVAEMVRAVSLALENVPAVRTLTLVGKERLIKKLLERAGLASDRRIIVEPANEVILMHDKPREVYKSKKDASMFRTMDMLKSGQGEIMVSCGNTGAMMFGGTLKLRPMPGVERPALGTAMPSRMQYFILIDAGANPTARPEHLMHQAILGAQYARIVLGLPNPRVGLLTIGTEEGKGTELILKTHEYLRSINGVINYAGPIEGFQVFQHAVDVIVCDGFTGNIVLKTCESLFLSMKDFLKDEIKKTPFRMAGAILSQGAFNQVKTQLNPDKYGGAPLLGLNGDILKAHGSSNRTAIMNAIRIGCEIVTKDMHRRSEEDIARANEIIGYKRT